MDTMKCISGFKYCKMLFEGLKITSNFPGNFKDGGYLNTINCSEASNSAAPLQGIWRKRPPNTGGCFYFQFKFIFTTSLVWPPVLLSIMDT